MATPQELSLSEVREEILIRLGFARSGGAVAKNKDLIDSLIRQSVRVLALEVPWQALVKELQIPLIQEQNRYEFPDESSIGGIQYVVAVDNTNRRWPMMSGIRPVSEVPTAAPDAPVPTGIPTLWRTIDNEIEIQPAAGENLAYLLIGYVAQTPQLRVDSEIMPFDSELIVQKAVVLGRIHYGRPGVAEGMRELERYMARVKARQNEPRDVSIGGATSDLLLPVRVNRVNANRAVGRNAVWTDGWTPWR